MGEDIEIMASNPVNPVQSEISSPIAVTRSLPLRLAQVRPGGGSPIQASLLALADAAALALAAPVRPVPAAGGAMVEVPWLDVAAVAVPMVNPGNATVAQAASALTSANAAALDAAATARDAAAHSIQAAGAASAAAEAVDAALAALKAASAGNGAEVRAASANPREAEDLGADATAKYLGGGAMSQAAGPGPAAPPGNQGGILAVNGVPSSTGLAENTYSNPHDLNFGQAAAHTAPLDPPDGPEVDLLS